RVLDPSALPRWAQQSAQLRGDPYRPGVRACLVDGRRVRLRAALEREERQRGDDVARLDEPSGGAAGQCRRGERERAAAHERQCLARLEPHRLDTADPPWQLAREGEAELGERRQVTRAERAVPV